MKGNSPLISQLHYFPLLKACLYLCLMDNYHPLVVEAVKDNFTLQSDSALNNVGSLVVHTFSSKAEGRISRY